MAIFISDKLQRHYLMFSFKLSACFLFKWSMLNNSSKLDYGICPRRYKFYRCYRHNWSLIFNWLLCKVLNGIKKLNYTNQQDHNRNLWIKKPKCSFFSTEQSDLYPSSYYSKSKIVVPEHILILHWLNNKPLFIYNM